jgi:hypothetical protein
MKYRFKKVITDASTMLGFIREISQEYYSIYGKEKLMSSLILDYTYNIYETEDYEFIAIDIDNRRIAEYKRCKG